MRKRLGFALPIALAMALAGAAHGQDPLPDPATIKTVAIDSRDPKVVADGHKFFFFHRADTSFAEAYSDIRECRSFIRRGAFPPQSEFVPWVEPAQRPVQSTTSPYGLVGAVIGSIIMPKLNRGLDNNMLRRCMEPRGYLRFPLPESSWSMINESADEQQNILMQAKLASGPVPPLAAVQDQ